MSGGSPPSHFGAPLQLSGVGVALGADPGVLVAHGGPVREDAETLAAAPVPQRAELASWDIPRTSQLLFHPAPVVCSPQAARCADPRLRKTAVEVAMDVLEVIVYAGMIALVILWLNVGR